MGFKGWSYWIGVLGREKEVYYVLGKVFLIIWVCVCVFVFKVLMDGVSYFVLIWGDYK